jgi:hypothetical protein
MAFEYVGGRTRARKEQIKGQKAKIKRQKSRRPDPEQKRDESWGTDPSFGFLTFDL